MHQTSDDIGVLSQLLPTNDVYLKSSLWSALLMPLPLPFASVVACAPKPPEADIVWLRPCKQLQLLKNVCTCRLPISVFLVFSFRGSRAVEPWRGCRIREQNHCRSTDITWLQQRYRHHHHHHHLVYFRQLGPYQKEATQTSLHKNKLNKFTYTNSSATVRIKMKW